MSPLLVRRRRRGIEVLDDPSVDPSVRERSLRDVARANRLLGGTHAALAELNGELSELRANGRRASLLDVGTGLGDIPDRARATAADVGVALETFGLDAAPSLAATSRTRVDHAACGDALALPFADASVDLVLCSQLLHHFEHAEAVQLLRELDRVGRRRVVVSDLRRSVVAAAGLWLASFAMRFHRVSRHDGVVSVLRGFTPGELSELVHEAVGARPTVRRRLGWRVTASWAPRRRAMDDPVMLGPLPNDRRMRTVDERIVQAPLTTVFELARDVEQWPRHLSHYRYVRFEERDRYGGGVVAMSANRPFGMVSWPTWWTSRMAIAAPGAGLPDAPWIRFHHVRGITTGMDVEWNFTPAGDATHVRIVHVWNGPRWPMIGGLAATAVIGPIFVHGIASRTLTGLAAAAETSTSAHARAR
jgi:SAM-dependent methyltransferase